jgi:annexin A7/11
MEIQTQYRNMYKNSMVEQVREEFSGRMLTLCLQLLEADRKDGNDQRVDQHVQELFEAGEGMPGTNEDVFVNLLTHFSRSHIERVSGRYESKYGKTLASAIKSEFTGYLRDSLVVLATPLVEFYGARFLRSFGTVVHFCSFAVVVV